MPIKNYKFFNLPKKYSARDYDASINYIIKKYSKLKDIVSIYNWGNPPVPGISDIDLVFVFKQNAESLPLFKRSFYFLNSKTRYLVRHPFMFIDESSFDGIKYIYPTTSFKLLYGKNIEIKNLDKSEELYAKIALLNDIIVRHYPRDFLKQVVKKRINVRDALLRLNSFKYTLKLLYDAAKIKNNEWDKKLNLIKNLRENWFKHNDFHLLVYLNEGAANITMEIINKFRSFLIKNKIVEISSGNSMEYNGIKNSSLFIKNWNKDTASLDMCEAIKNEQKFHSILPLELSAQTIEYSKFDGLISNYIKNNISDKINYKLKHKNVIEKRIKILNKQAELAAKLRHSDFAAFFDFGYRNKFGLNNWVLNVMDRLRF